MRLQRIGKNARLTAAIAMTLFSASVSTVYALPIPYEGTSEKPVNPVTSGKAAITTAGDVMNIETSDRVAIDWTSFNIEKNETVNFIQPNANSIALNRVVGNEMSHIYGNLNANGKVFLINENGILFGKDAVIDVGGLVASTGQLKEVNNTNTPFNIKKFADGEDFVIEGMRENTAAVINQAAIKARIKEEGGLVVFHATNIKNEGTIETGNGGIVQLDAVKKLNINYDSDKINFTVAVDDTSGVRYADILNAGTISAQNGIIAMTTRGYNEAINSVVNTDGARPEAKGLFANANGEIILDAGTVGKFCDGSYGVVDSGNSLGVVSVGGTVDASKVTVKGGSAYIDGALNTSNPNSSCDIHTTCNVEIKNMTLDFDTSDDNYTTKLSELIGKGNAVISTNALSYKLNVADVNITAHNDKQMVSDIIISDSVTKTSDKATTLTLTADRNVVFEAEIATDKDLNITTKAGSEIPLEQGTRDGELYGANIIWKNISTKGDINLGNNSFIGIREVTPEKLSESGRSISGNNVTFGGDVVIALADTLEINVERDAKIEGSISSGNGYTGGSIAGLKKYVKFDNNEVDYWGTARREAINGTGGGSAVGDSYLVTITDGIEDSAVAAALPSRTTKAYAGGMASDWDGDTPGQRTRTWKWADGPEAGQVFFVQTTEESDKTRNNKVVSGYATMGYTNFAAGEPNNDGTSGQPVMSVGFNNTKSNWPGYGNDYTMSRWDDAYRDKTGSSRYLYVRETNLRDSSLKINAGGEIEIGPIGDKRGLNEVVLNAEGKYRFNPDDAAVIKLQITEMMASPTAVQGSAEVEAADSARVSGVEKVAGLMNGQLLFYKAKDDRIIPGGVLEISATPDTVKVKVNPAAEGVPDISKVKDANQYREYQKMLDTVDGAADFKLTYNGASFEIYPVDRNAQAVLQKGDSAGNMDVTADALHTAFSEMGLSLEDMAAVCVHMNA